jgi:hypothetical protein
VCVISSFLGDPPSVDESYLPRRWCVDGCHIRRFVFSFFLSSVQIAPSFSSSIVFTLLVPRLPHVPPRLPRLHLLTLLTALVLTHTVTHTHTHTHTHTLIISLALACSISSLSLSLRHMWTTASISAVACRICASPWSIARSLLRRAGAQLSGSTSNTVVSPIWRVTST